MRVNAPPRGLIADSGRCPVLRYQVRELFSGREDPGTPTLRSSREDEN